ncbi:hypothetical protein JK358_35710 [Nocardia sp. 2]|uniref:HTH luxR-type domain-containing protein n=1 Tax=Nocardia acididurans TaxID=2802282 RepID=A0ABS1MGS1_9NOCA|nr:AAA family ATPase [Nocardia acididurans]MBL1079762.1 hypothetical protein [Nocardia acididurans]
MHGTRRDDDPPTTELIGRHSELLALAAVLDTGPARLITLVGPGGIGKTRLVTEAAHRVLPATGRTVHQARLGRLFPNADTGTIAEEVVRSIARTDIAGRSAWDVLIDTLGTVEPCVLILDNCEHVLTGTAPLIVTLLEALPNLTIIATSREPVGWADEYILTVPPLPPEQAIGLFKRRARAIGKPIGEDPRALAIAEQICAMVDHNPLFITLAAARLTSQSLDAVLRELSGDAHDQRLTWSDDSDHPVDDRHRGVRNAIAWSYDICTPPEQILLERLSVFAAGFESSDDQARCGAELDDILAVCADPTLPEPLIADQLERLVERSLVSVQFTTTTVRYYLLHSVRVFADRRLALRQGPSNRSALATRHRRHYREQVLANQVGWYGLGEDRWLEWTRDAWDNILQAIEASLTDPGEATVGLEIAIALMATRAPFVHGANRIVTRLTEQALDITRDADTTPTALRVAATAMVGWTALWQGRQDYTNVLLDECVSACLPQTAHTCDWRSTARIDIGLPPAVEFTWGIELILVELDPNAVDVLARAHTKFQREGDEAGAKRSELYEALAGALFRPPRHALDTARRYLEQARATGTNEEIAWAELTWLIALTTHGDPREAERVGRALIADRLAAGDRWTAGMLVHYVMAAAARVLAEDLTTLTPDRNTLTTRALEIATLQGGLTTLHHALGFAVRRTPLIARETEHAITTATAVLGPAIYSEAARRGARMRPDHDELQRFVVGTLSLDDIAVAPTPAQQVPTRWQDLSRAESDCALLAAAGWSNSAIAQRRGTSIRTVEAQLAAIRQKLMITTRSDIIWHVPENLEDHIRTAIAQRPNTAAAKRTV